MKKNVFAAGMMMAAIALAGCGAMTNAIAPSIRAEAIDTEVAAQFNEDQKAAEKTALRYTGVCYEVVSFDMLYSGNQTVSYKVGVQMTGDSGNILFLNVNGSECYALNGYNGMNPAETDAFFAKKRIAEFNIRTKLGMRYDVISYQYNGTKFRFDVREPNDPYIHRYYDKGEGTIDPNPIACYSGHYENGEDFMIDVFSSNENEGRVMIRWNLNSGKQLGWDLTGTVTSTDDGVVLTFDHAEKFYILFDENGRETSHGYEYKNGTGRMIFRGDKMIWEDDQEQIADGMVFTFKNY